MKLKELKQELELLERVEVSIEGNTIRAKGKKGENSRSFHYPNIKITKENNKLIFSSKNPTKREKRMMGTISSHIKNLMKGVSQGFLYKLKICSGHFPMSVTIHNNHVIINNFLGEKTPRKAKILPRVEAKIQSDEILLEGIDKESVAQSSANIERATRITNRDRRVFQDGIWIFSKDGKEIK